MDPYDAGEQQPEPRQGPLRTSSLFRQVSHSSLLGALLFAFGALIVAYSWFSSLPTVTRTQTPTLRQDLAQASPTARPAVAVVAPRAGSPNSTPTPTPTLQEDRAPANPVPTEVVAQVVQGQQAPNLIPSQEPAATYRVITGDTLRGIAAKFNVPVNLQAVWIDETMCLNGIVYADRLLSGQELWLPSPGSLAVALPSIEKRLNAVPTQVSLRPTSPPPGTKTLLTATPRKTPSRPGTPTRTPTPRPVTVHKSPGG